MPAPQTRRAMAILAATALAAAVQAQTGTCVNDLPNPYQLVSDWAHMPRAWAATNNVNVDANISANDVRGGADWQAWYRFSATGRAVHNRIHASINFRDGLIAQHQDRFSFWAWARQALGLPGLLLGWSPFLHAKVVAQAAAKLAIDKARRAS